MWALMVQMTSMVSWALDLRSDRRLVSPRETLGHQFGMSQEEDTGLVLFRRSVHHLSLMHFPCVVPNIRSHRHAQMDHLLVDFKDHILCGALKDREVGEFRQSL